MESSEIDQENLQLEIGEMDNDILTLLETQNDNKSFNYSIIESLSKQIEECRSELRELNKRIESLEEVNRQTFIETNYYEETSIKEISKEGTIKEERIEEMKEVLKETRKVEEKKVYNKKVLVCMVGNLENSQITWDSFKSNVLDNLESYDLSLCIGAKSEEEFKNNPYFINSKYKWVYHEPKNWNEIYEFIGNSNTKGKFSYDLIKTMDTNFGENFRRFFYYWYLKQKIEELKLEEEYEYFYITNSSYYHECKLISLEKLQQDFYLFETKGNNMISFDNFITNYKNLFKLSDYILNILVNDELLRKETKIISQGNISKLNYWYLIKVIGSNCIGYILPTMYRVWGETADIKRLGLVKSKENNFYYENSLTYLNVKKNKNYNDTYKNLVIHVPSNEPKPIVTTHIQPTFRNNTKGSMFVRPPRKR